MIAVHPSRRPLSAPWRDHLPRLRAAAATLAWCGRWLGLGLALGALTDLIVRIAA